MQLIDTHSHLSTDNFKSDLDLAIQRAKEAGVTKIFNPNTDSTTIDRIAEISEQYPDTIYPLMGLDPGAVRDNFEQELQIVEQHLRSRKYYGIGEIGIDLYWEDNIKYKTQQIQVFEHQVKLAKELTLPIIIHSRNSFDEVFSVIDKHNDEKLFGIFHCFTGNLSQAQKIIEYGGFKMGIGGVLTYKNSPLPQVVKNIALEHLVLETDSPYLPPVPKRGKRNESAFLLFTANKLADIHEVTLDEVAQITTKNAIEVYRL